MTRCAKYLHDFNRIEKYHWYRRPKISKHTRDYPSRIIARISVIVWSRLQISRRDIRSIIKLNERRENREKNEETVPRFRVVLFWQSTPSNNRIPTLSEQRVKRLVLFYTYRCSTTPFAQSNERHTPVSCVAFPFSVPRTGQIPFISRANRRSSPN